MLVDGRVGVVAGLPKAAVITHLQSLKAAAGFWAYGGSEDDVVYIPLPLYHSAASLIGVGGTIEMGKTAAVYLSIGCVQILLKMHHSFLPYFHTSFLPPAADHLLFYYWLDSESKDGPGRSVLVGPWMGDQM